MSMATELDISRAARLFHALSDETRLDIIMRLLDGEKCVCDLTDALDAAQSRLSFHLKTLKEAGIVNDRKVGRWVYYTMDRDAFAEIEEVIKSIKPSRKAFTTSNCCT